jgi:hypothetical protein
MLMDGDSPPREAYLADGLAQFASTGFGKFIASPREPNDRESYTRCVFELGAHSFTYRWEASKDGKNYQATAIFRMTRKDKSIVKTP